MISTTNAYKLVQEKEVRIAKDLALSQAQLFPLRKENARIARDNHDLHADTIRLNDDLRNAEDNHSREMQKVQEHLQDSRFQCEALNAQLREKEEKLDKLRMVNKCNAAASSEDPLLLAMYACLCSFAGSCRTHLCEGPVAAQDLTALAPSRCPQNLAVLAAMSPSCRPYTILRPRPPQASPLLR